MPMFGLYSEAEVQRLISSWKRREELRRASAELHEARIERQARREGRREACDEVGRDANQVWTLWCIDALTSGRKPPALCPHSIIRKVRADLELEGRL